MHHVPEAGDWGSAHRYTHTKRQGKCLRSEALLCIEVNIQYYERILPCAER